MAFLVHALIFALYLAASLAVAFALPRLVPEVGSDLALFAGGACLFVAALTHQGLAGLRRTRRFVAKLDTLAQSNGEIGRELKSALDELRGLRERMPIPMPEAVAPAESDPPPPAEPEGPPATDSEAELQLLKTLFAQLPREAPPEPAALPAGAAPLGLSSGADERLVVAAGGARAARVGTPGRALLNGVSDYRQAMMGGHGDAVAVLDAYSPAASRGPTIEQDPIGAAILAATRDALERARVALFVQPIVALPNRRVRFYETFSRIRLADGELIGPERYLRIATEAGLIAAIGNNLLFRCVQLMRRLRRHDRAYGFFCNISPHTLGDDTFFPQFVEFLADNAELAGDLVFEFTQADGEQHYDNVAANLQRLARLGYRFSLDRVSRQGLNFKALAERQFRFVKFDTTQILDLQAAPDGPARIDRLVADASAAGIAPIVEKMETERELVELLDHRFPFGQGYLFGAPKESRTR
jgi:cyclic-di-GMP phosphodiesterase TipF (flagellum assembly factor)